MNCGFSERITGPQLTGDDYVLAFRCNGSTKFAVWTTSWLSRTVKIPVSPGPYRLTNVTGESESEKMSTQSGLTLKLSSSPEYLESKRSLKISAKSPAFLSFPKLLNLPPLSRTTSRKCGSKSPFPV
jgi:hypothetical protein